MKLAALAALSLALGPCLHAQTAKEASPNTANPIVNTVRQMEGRYAKNLSGAADEMPADKYSYRPTPEQITFGHLMMHVAEANNTLCALAGGEQPHEQKLSDTDPKEVLSKAVKDSFAYCEQVLGKADDSTMGQAVSAPGGQTTTRGSAMLRLVANWADHYSAASGYLRLNNLLPPSAQKAEGKH
jgi:hypothetical protein